MKQNFLSSVIILTILIMICALFALPPSDGVAASREVAAFSTATPRFRRTSTATLTRTPTSIVNTLKTQLVFGGLGAGPGANNCTSELGKNTPTYPRLISSGRLDPFPYDVSEARNYVGLCIYGIPFTEGFTIDLYHPDGVQVSHSEFRDKKIYEDNFGWSLEKISPKTNAGFALGNYINDAPVISLDLWIPAGAPAGQWYARVSAPNGSTAGTFEVPARPNTPIVHLGRPPDYLFPNADPLGELQGDYAYMSVEPLVLKMGDTLKLYGVGFQTGSVTPIGAYLLSYPPEGNVQANLIGQTQARANQRGEWMATYTIQPTDPPGDYELIVVLDTKLNASYEPGPHFAYTTTSWKPCPNTYTSLLKPGIRARVIEGQQANRLRSQPTRSGNNQIGRIPAGETFDILDGPRCADSWVWWYVKTKNGQRGWTAEGDQSERWLEPVD